MELEIFNCEQGTQEWFDVRAGVITASEMDKVLAVGRGGTDSIGRAKYMRQLAAELITGKPAERGFQGNAHTERGKELEPIARELYETHSGNKVEQVGFLKRGRLGCSPDGLIGTEGGLELKAKLPEIQIEILQNGKMPAEHYKQIQSCMKVTGRPWWDFASYSPGLPLFIERQYPDHALFQEIESKSNAFLAELDSLVKLIKGKF